MGLLLACRHLPGFLSIESVCLVCLLTPGRLTPQLCEEDTSQLKTRAHSLVQLY